MNSQNVIVFWRFSPGMLKFAELALFKTHKLPTFKTPSLLIYHSNDDFDSADPSSMQDVCYIRAQLNDLAVHEFG